MDARLIPLNAFIGLVSPPATSWPNPLFAAGYGLVALELPLDAGGQRVVADAVAFNPATNRFLVAEAKSGLNIRPEQARRYRFADGEQLVRHTGVTVSVERKLTVDPLYLCLASNVDRILTGLREASCAYPVLSVSEQAITLNGDVDSGGDLERIFASSVAVNGWPPSIVRLDEESDASEFEAVASQALLTEVNRGSSRISVRDLAGRAIPHLHICGTRYRNSLIRKLERAVAHHCSVSPANFRFRPPTASRDYSIVEVLDSPERADPRGRTQRYQAIRRRLRGGLDSSSSARQPALFDNLDLGTELEDPVAAGPDAAQGEHEEGEA